MINSRAMDRVRAAVEAMDGRYHDVAGGARCRGLCHGGENPDTVSVQFVAAIGKVRMKCFKGCPDEDVIAAYRLTWADLYEQPHPKSRGALREFEYPDRNGSLIGVASRTRDKPGGGKDFFPLTPNGKSWDLKASEDLKSAIYNWPQVAEALADNREIHLCSGERDADSLNRLGMTATTNYGGEMNFKPVHADHLKGGKVVVVLDNDATGERRLPLVAPLLRAVGASVSAVRPPEGFKDITDMLVAGRPIVDLVPVPLPDSDQPEGDDNQTGGPLPGVLVWPEFFTTDFSRPEWLPGRLMTRGQHITIIGDGKAGKSLFCLDWVWRAATGRPFLETVRRDPIRVLYLDQENAQPDIQGRLRALDANAGPETMGGLIYASFPPIPPLDTPAGAAALRAYVEEYQPDLVVIDTISRFIAGKENDSDTWLAVYRNTIVPLKRLGISSVRLDHFGKDAERGSRGSSAKTQDIDHVWELVAVKNSGLTRGSLLQLKRTHTRTGIGPGNLEVVRFGRLVKDGDDEYWAPGETRHSLIDPNGKPHRPLPGSVEDIAARLDAAGIPSTLGRQRIQVECFKLGIQASAAKLSDVVKLRKSRPESPESPVLRNGNNLFPDLDGKAVPDTGTGAPVPAGQTCSEQVGNRSGASAGEEPVPSPPSKEGTGSDSPSLCASCGRPMHPDFVALGRSTHVACPPVSPTDGQHLADDDQAHDDGLESY